MMWFSPAFGSGASEHLRTTIVFASAVAALSLLGCSGPAANNETVSYDKLAVVLPPAPTATNSSGTAASQATAASTKPAKPAGHLDIVTADSKIEFAGFKPTGKHDGKFEKFSGWVYIDGDNLESARLYLEIDIASVKTDVAMLDEHLKSVDFFDVAEHPTSTFELTELTKDGAGGATHIITGNLKLRGVEKSVSFPAKVTLGKDEVKTVAEFTISRSAWGVNYPGRPNDLIQDAVLIRLDVTAK